jgi:asparagine synthase (glutamine-hydrolysing)
MGMCGIAGIIGATDLDQAEIDVRRMIESIAHRGPNGIRVERVGNAVLAHARLSIIDLEGGWQPLHAAGGTVIGNGEIYNYLELIEEFELQDKLVTGSDFEPLLHLYALEGEKAFSRLRGMYAFCLIGGDGRTWLVRDPFGIKPLYTALASESSAVYLASEPRALWSLPDQPEQRAMTSPVEEVLSLGYSLGTIPVSPWASRLFPGEIEQRTADGKLASGTFQSVLAWSPQSANPRGSGDPDLGGSAKVKTWVPASAGMSGEVEAVRALDRILEDSVRVHQRSDVPYGLFLSGGIDSTAIATLMARLNQRPVIAYTCGWEGTETHDERSAAEKVARALNLDWRETVLTEEDFWRIAPEIAWALDDPTTDFACLPTYKLAEVAKGTLTVVLSGEGGDELFAGYGRYRRATRPKWLGGRAAEPQVDAPFLTDGGAGALARWREAARLGGGSDSLSGAQAADIATWLPNDLLLKLDRCLMAHGLEGRTPFLDREVAAFAFALPDRMKVRGRHGKWILRKWLEQHCPAAEPWARKKGFTVPVAGFIAPRAADLARTIPLNEGVRQVCNPEAVRAVFTDPAQAHNRWPLLFYALWWSIHIHGMGRGEALAALLAV